MSQLKRYVCQAGKVLIGIPICILAAALIVAFSFWTATAICYLLENFLIVQLAVGCAIGLLLLAFAFVVGDIIFKKYNICQRFK